MKNKILKSIAVIVVTMLSFNVMASQYSKLKLPDNEFGDELNQAKQEGQWYPYWGAYDAADAKRISDERYLKIAQRDGQNKPARQIKNVTCINGKCHFTQPQAHGNYKLYIEAKEQLPEFDD